MKKKLDNRRVTFAGSKMKSSSLVVVLHIWRNAFSQHLIEPYPVASGSEAQEVTDGLHVEIAFVDLYDLLLELRHGDFRETKWCCCVCGIEMVFGGKMDGYVYDENIGINDSNFLHYIILNKSTYACGQRFLFQGGNWLLVSGRHLTLGKSYKLNLLFMASLI